MIATTPRISRRSTSVRGRSPTRNADIHATRTTNAVTPAKKTREATPVRRHTPRDKTVIAASGGPSTASTPAKRAREKSPAAGRSPAPSKTTKSPTGSRTSSVSKGSRSTPRSTPEKDVPSDADASEGEDDRMEEINKRETMKKMKEAEKKAFEKCKMAGVKNQGVVKKNDVIWARYQQAPLWPALVVNAQPKKITYVFFPLPKDGSIPTTRFSCNPKNVFRLSMGEDTPKGADRHFYSVLMEAKRYIWNRGDLEGSEAILRPDSKPMTEAQLRHELPQAVDAVLEMRKKQKDEADKKKAERDKKELDAAKEAEKNKADTSKEKDKTGVRKDEETAEKQMEAVEDKNDELRKDKEVAREENDVARELMAKEKAKKEGERETTKKQDDDVIIIEQKQEVEEEANKGEKEAVEEDNDEASEDEEEQVDKSRKENMEEDSEEMSSEFTYGVDYYYLVENPKEGRAYLEKLTKKYARIFKKNETDLKRKEDGAVEDAEGKEPEVQKEQQDDEVNEPLLKKPRRVRNWEPEMPGSFTSYAEETVVEKMDTGFLEAPEPATQKTTRLCTMEVNDRFSRVVHDNYERIMEALYNTDNVRNFVVPPRGHFSCSFSSATRFLSAYNSDFLFERIKEFVEKKSPESPSLHTYLLITYVLFPEIVAHCMSIYSGSSLGDAMFCLFGAKNAAASNK